MIAAETSHLMICLLGTEYFVAGVYRWLSYSEPPSRVACKLAAYIYIYICAVSIFIFLPATCPTFFRLCVLPINHAVFSWSFFFCESLALYAPLLIYWRLRSLASNSSCKLQEMMGCVHYGLKLLPPASFRYRLALCVCPNRSPSFPFYRLAWKKG